MHGRLRVVENVREMPEFVTDAPSCGGTVPIAGRHLLYTLSPNTSPNREADKPIDGRTISE